jgi:hypothetical protein
MDGSELSKLAEAELALRKERLLIEQEKLGVEKRELARKIRKLNAEEEREKCDQRDAIQIRVGDEIFSTTLSTLTKARFFELQFGTSYGNVEVQFGTTKLNAVPFVDRSAERFRFVLEWLRDGTLSERIKPEMRQGLIMEADFFGIDSLGYYLKGETDPTQLRGKTKQLATACSNWPKITQKIFRPSNWVQQSSRVAVSLIFSLTWINLSADRLLTWNCL